MPFLFFYSGKEDSDDTCDEDEVTGSDMGPVMMMIMKKRIQRTGK